MSVIQDIIKNEGDPDSWPVDVHEYTRQQTLFWESYLLIFKYSFTEQLSVSRVWSGEDTASPPPDWARSWSQTNTGLTYSRKTEKLKLLRPFKRGQRFHFPLCFKLHDANSNYFICPLPGWVLSLIGGCASRIPPLVCSRGSNESSRRLQEVLQ